MKKIVALSTLRAQPTRILSLQLPDAHTSIADTNIRDNEVTSNVSEAENPDSASATITITWTTAPSEGG